MDLDWPLTIAILNFSVMLFIWANLAGRKPSDPLNPRMWSPVLVMAIAAVAAILMLAHIITLATGQPFQGGGF